jgi:hypothetical protein
MMLGTRVAGCQYAPEHGPQDPLETVPDPLPVQAREPVPAPPAALLRSGCQPAHTSGAAFDVSHPCPSLALGYAAIVRTPDERDELIFGMTPAVLQLEEHAARGRAEMMARLAGREFVAEYPPATA